VSATNRGGKRRSDGIEAASGYNRVACPQYHAQVTCGPGATCPKCGADLSDIQQVIRDIGAGEAVIGPPPFRYALPQLDVRVFLPFIETHMSDREAWEAPRTGTTSERDPHG